MSNDFYVVALGASAGGLKAISDFFEHLKEVPDCAFIIVQHLKRDYPSKLKELLSRKTSLEVIWIAGGEVIEPYKVYILPENYKLTIHHRRLLLEERSSLEVINHTINHFLISLAEDVKDKAIAIIMSGTGSDGTKGLHQIEQQGGVTIVQDPDTAEFDGMPLHSIRFDHPDYIVGPGEMPSLLQNIIRGRENRGERKKRRMNYY